MLIMQYVGPNRDLFDFIKEHDCSLNFPEVEIDKTPLNIKNIKDAQDGDPGLQRMLQKIPNCHFSQNIGHIRNEICHVKLGKNRCKKWTISLPRQLIKPAVKWFHLVILGQNVAFMTTVTILLDTSFKNSWNNLT